MGPPSLTIHTLPTTTTTSIPLFSSLTSIVPPSPLPFPLNAVSQNILMSAAGAIRNKGAGAQQQPPRPPNAWILYRSDKLQQLPPPALGQSKPTQAEVSKIISAQWKAEPDEVRAMYDERAQIAKLEHARLYPNYRFTPMKRADKDRMREEKRQAKEQERAGRRTARGRASPYTVPSSTSTSICASSSFFPNAKTASPPVSSASSPLPGTPSSQSSVDIALRFGSTHPSHDPYTPDPRSSSRASSYSSSRADIPVATPLPVVPPHLLLSTPQIPSQNASPSPSTAFLSPLQEFSLSDWLQSGRPNEALSPLEDNNNIFFSMPDPLQDMSTHSLLAELYGTELPGVFQLQSVANPNLTARPPGSIDLGIGNYPPPGTWGSPAFDDALRALGDDPETFMGGPTADELLAAINLLAPPEAQENDALVLAGSSATSTDPLQSSFNFDEYIQDLNSSVLPLGEGAHSVTVTLSVPRNSPPSSSSESAPSPMPSFYATTPSPVSSSIEPSPPPPAPQQVKKQPYVPPRGAANAAARRVGATWKVPLAVSNLRSPISSCASSPKPAAA